jgi:hypothetical protein
MSRHHAARTTNLQFAPHQQALTHASHVGARLTAIRGADRDAPGIG